MTVLKRLKFELYSHCSLYWTLCWGCGYFLELALVNTLPLFMLLHRLLLVDVALSWHVS